MTVQFKMDWEKTLAALSYLASGNVPELTKGKLCKLLFLADKYHLVRFARPITGDLYWAIDNGPIPSAILDRLELVEEGKEQEWGKILQLDRSYAYPRLSAKSPVQMETLSESDRIALDRAIQQFGKLTFAQLRALTHEMPAYQLAWEKRGSGGRAPMCFEDFFTEDEDAVVGAREEMLENYEIERVFTTR